LNIFSCVVTYEEDYDRVAVCGADLPKNEFSQHGAVDALSSVVSFIFKVGFRAGSCTTRVTGCRHDGPEILGARVRDEIGAGVRSPRKMMREIKNTAGIDTTVPATAQIQPSINSRSRPIEIRRFAISSGSKPNGRGR
jgi:hypothetical protein